MRSPFFSGLFYILFPFFGRIFRRIFGRRGCRERGLFAFHFMDAAAFYPRRAERQAGADDDIHIITQNAPDQHGGESRPAREVVREDEIKGNFARARVAGGGDERHRGVQDAHDLRKIEPFAETVHVRQVVAEGFQREVGDGKHRKLRCERAQRCQSKRALVLADAPQAFGVAADHPHRFADGFIGVAHQFDLAAQADDAGNDFRGRFGHHREHHHRQRSPGRVPHRHRGGQVQQPGGLCGRHRGEEPDPADH